MARQDGTVFRARLEQASDGIYRAFYQHDAGPAEPDVDTGTSEQTVRQFVESLAHNQGYDSVVWEP